MWCIVVEFSKRDRQYSVNDESIFFELVKNSFTQKRKTLRNNLKGYDLDKVSKVLEKYGKDLNVRAEALDVEVFVEIANELS